MHDMHTVHSLRSWEPRRRTVAFALAWGLVALAVAGCTVTPATNSPPAATGQTVSANAGEATTITLGATDADGDALTYIVLSLASNGTLSEPGGVSIDAVPHTLSGGGMDVVYTPTNGFEGADSFTFTANDGTANGNTATVNITVGAGSVEPDIDEDTAMDSLSVLSGETLRVGNGAVLRITGDATIDGTMETTDGALTLIVEGEFVVNGTLRSANADTSGVDSGQPFTSQSAGIHIVVGAGAVTLNESAVFETTGNIVVTDDEDVLDGTPSDAFDEVEDVGTSALDTLVPLPPDNPAFDTNGAEPKVAPLMAKTVTEPPITVTGTWPPPGAPAPAGDKPVTLFRFNGNRDIILRNLTINGPPAPAGRNDDETGEDDEGDDAKGRNGRNGMRLNIWNNGGPINITGPVVLTLTDGGDGGDADATCADATGGDGGKAGNFRMTASGGINISNGTLVINPGAGGNGGAATVTKGSAGASGCPGDTGADATATGGAGADNKKRLLIRGNVTGITNIQIGDLFGGDGGPADASACDGGDGIACCDGGAGGAASATGGKGGDASLNVGGNAVTVSDVFGGDGGDATATGGNGGNGGDCKFGDGGDGGAGGDATATSGGGGEAVSNAGAAVGGDSGDATATAGDGGAGGDSGFGTPGAGGDAGAPTATAGEPGDGDTAGTKGEEDPQDGAKGADGGPMAVTLFCFPLAFVQEAEGPFPPGRYTGTVFAEDDVTELGSLAINFPEIEMPNYQRGNNPLPHVGIGGVGEAAVDIELVSLQLVSPPPGDIGGLRIEPLQAFGIDATNPIRVQALASDGRILGEQTHAEIPNNTLNAETPEPVDSYFDIDFEVETIDTFRIIFPEGTFTTVIRIYLLDP